MNPTVTSKQADTASSIRKPWPAGLSRRFADASPTTAFWSAFVVLFMMFGTWAIANPLTAAPDEASHLTKAAAVVRGQLTGTPVPDHEGFGYVDVPATVALTMDQICYRFKSEEPASCMEEFEGDPLAVEQSITTASNYNPLYYALVGLPTYLPSYDLMYYGSRLLSAFWCALALAWGFRSLRELTSTPWIAVGMLAAVVPMVVFLASSVNPAALELVAALSLWVSLAALLARPTGDDFRVRVAGLAILASVFVNARGFSPMFLVIMALTVGLYFPWKSSRTVITDRRSWPWFGLTAVASLAALLWIRTQASITGGGEVAFPENTFRTAFIGGLKNIDGYLANMLGHFGWVDTPLPTWAYVCLGAVMLFPVLTALALGGRRDRLVLVGLSAFCFITPLIIQANQAKYIGYVWQGRYFLPLVMGVLVLSGFTVRRAFTAAPPGWSTKLLATLSIVMMAIQFEAFIVNHHRYQAGLNGPWLSDLPNEWNAPVPTPVLVVAFALQLAALVWLSLRLTTERTALPAQVSVSDTV